VARLSGNNPADDFRSRDSAIDQRMISSLFAAVWAGEIMSTSSTPRDCPFTIRAATVQDIEGILHCLACAFEPYRREYTIAGYEDTVLNRETLSLRMLHMTILVAVDPGNNILGTIACQPLAGGEGHMRGMAVLPAHQGQGIADELIQRAEKTLCEHGSMFVTLDTTEPLQRAMHFYERKGFVRTGKVADFFGMPLIEYAKKLDRTC
jgi:ribosomal protein S18 acetylase RimI-like enzyme